MHVTPPALARVLSGSVPLLRLAQCCCRTHARWLDPRPAACLACLACCMLHAACSASLYRACTAPVEHVHEGLGLWPALALGRAQADV